MNGELRYHGEQRNNNRPTPYGRSHVVYACSFLHDDMDVDDVGDITVRLFIWL